MTLRVQLLLVALVVLLLPLAGWRFLKGTERFMRQSQEQALIARADAMARMLGNAGALPAAREGRELYARRVDYPLVVDGYADDWSLWEPWAQHFGSGNPPPVTVMLARDRRNLYAYFRVADKQRRYLAPGTPPDAADHLVLRPGGGDNLLIGTAAPGSLEAGSGAGRVQGQWQELGDGYGVELRIPLGAVGDSLGFAVRDGGAGWLAATGGTGDPAAPVPLVWSDPDLEGRLKTMAPAGVRVWLLDSNGWVLARVGSLAHEGDGGGRGRWWRGLVYRYLLAPPMDVPRPRPDIAPRLDEPEVLDALAGRASVRWQSAAGSEAVRASAAVPVDPGGSVQGALVMEQATDALLAFTNESMLRLMGLTLVAFVAAALALLLLASVLSLRIRRLRNAAERSLTRDGRLRAGFPRSRARDEIGDLGRSFASLLEELRGHTDYLRTLADKLSHELRTPIAMVRSSLDNLEQSSLPKDAQTYAQRAREGTERLSAIVRAMAEASRLEQSILESPRERFEPAALVDAQISAWRDMRADRRFELDGPAEPFRVTAAPELISRLLDKLMENAVDFAPDGGMIRVSVASAGDTWRLAVFNEGPSLPPEMGARLFDSMTSGRGERGDAPHLGLGLYVARLIAEHHGGTIEAHNAEGGVEFVVNLPP